MPHIKISRPPTHADKNTGSSRALMEYLDKENEGIESAVEKEYFFSHTEDMVFKEDAIRGIDYNKKGLKKTDTKYYEMSVAFSAKEINHLHTKYPKKHDLDHGIKTYVRGVMDEYAKNFERDRVRDGADLVYYAKIEHQRRYDPKSVNPEERQAYIHNYRVNAAIKDLELIGSVEKAREIEKDYIRNENGQVILPGNVKDGRNTHVHVVASRQDKTQSISLSPLANSRGSMNKLNGREVAIGFSRDNFVENSEKLFDKLFDYQRPRENQYRELLQAKAIRNGSARFNTFIKDPDRFFENMARSAVNKVFSQGLDRTLNAFGKKEIVRELKTLTPSTQNQLQKTATQRLATELATTHGKNLALKVMPIHINAVIKAISWATEQLRDHSKDHER